MRCKADNACQRDILSISQSQKKNQVFLADFLLQPKRDRRFQSEEFVDTDVYYIFVLGVYARETSVISGQCLLSKSGLSGLGDLQDRLIWWCGD